MDDNVGLNANDLRNKRKRNYEEMVTKYVSNILDKCNADAQHWNVSQYEIPIEYKEDVIKELEEKDFKVTYLDQDKYSILTIMW